MFLHELRAKERFIDSGERSAWSAGQKYARRQPPISPESQTEAHRTSAGTRVPGEESDDDLIAVLVKLGKTRKEAERIAARIPRHLPLQERVRMAFH